MDNYSYHLPFYIVTGGVATQGQSSDLASGQVGLFDVQTWGVVSPSNNGNEFFFAQGVIGGKDWYGNPYSQKSHKSAKFFGKDIYNIYKSFPKSVKNEKWVIGYNGSTSSKGLSFKKEEATRLHITLFDGPAYRYYNGPKDYTVSYTPDKACPDGCGTNCDPDCSSDCLDCVYHTKKLVDLVNNHSELPKFGVRAQAIFTPYTATTPNMQKYKLCVCDEGDVTDLQKVQAQYPTKSIKRISRSGSTSCYEFCQKIGDAAPAAFQLNSSVSLATCGTCEVGWTLVNGEDIYLVNRPLSGSEDLSSTIAQQTFANTIATAYTAVDTFDATVAGVTVGTDTITVTGHGLATGTKVVYSNGGGTSITGLTSGSAYYVVSTGANTLKLASTYANAVAAVPVVVDLTAVGVGVAHTLSVAVTGTYLGNNGSTAIVKLTVPYGVAITGILADIVTLEYRKEASCVSPVGATVAWSATTTGISSVRTLRVNNVKRPDCNNASNRMADLTLAISGIPGVVIGTLTKIAGDSCVDDYTVTQESDDCLTEECLSNQISFSYADLPAFEGNKWEVVPVGDGNAAPGVGVKCGILLEAAFTDPKFGNCSFDPMDYYENKPIRMEVSLLSEGGNNCDYKALPTVSKRQEGQIARQSGEYVIREAIKAFEIHQKDNIQFDKSPRMREALGQNLLSMVDRNAKYVLYYVTFKASYGNITFRNGDAREEFTAVFAFKENDPAQFQFESQIAERLSAKSGKVLHIAE